MPSVFLACRGGSFARAPCVRPGGLAEGQSAQGSADRRFQGHRRRPRAGLAEDRVGTARQSAGQQVAATGRGSKCSTRRPACTCCSTAKTAS